MIQNIYSLLENPIPVDNIPKVPKFKYMIAEGGEITYDLPRGVKFGDGKQVIPIERKAVKGERLMDKKLLYRIDTTENKIFRGERVRLCQDNERAREIEMMYCASDIRYFCNVYGWTRSPGQPLSPFILYDFQDDLMTWWLWVVNMNLSCLVEKSRAMGASWLIQVLNSYICLFFPGKVCYEFSMTEKEVDNRLEDSLFGKLRVFIMSLPSWMRQGWSEYGRDPETHEYFDKTMALTFPQNGSLIGGELTGSNAGRSGRSNVNFYDEFSYVENAPHVLNASASLTDTKIFASTVRGMNNEFARIAHNPTTLKKSLHWSAHPLKNDKWAILTRSDPSMTDESWAQEFDIKYTTSTPGRVFPGFRSYTSEGTWSHIQCDNPYWDYDPGYPVYVGIDFGISDPNAILYCQFKQVLPNFQNSFGNILVIFDEDIERDNDDEIIAKKLKSRGYDYASIVGDLRTGNRRDYSGKTLVSRLAGYGIKVVGRFNSEEGPIRMTRLRLSAPGGLSINKYKCPKTVEAFQNWAFPTDKYSGMPLTDSKPLHNKYSHSMKAICYLVDYVDGGAIVHKKKNGDKRWSFNPIKNIAI